MKDFFKDPVEEYLGYSLNTFTNKCRGELLNEFQKCLFYLEGILGRSPNIKEIFLCTCGGLKNRNYCFYICEGANKFMVGFLILEEIPNTYGGTNNCH